MPRGSPLAESGIQIGSTRSSWRGEHLRLHQVSRSNVIFLGFDRLYVWVRVGMERATYLRSRSTSLHEFLVLLGLVLGELRAGISHDRMQPRVHKFGVVLVQHLLLNDSIVLSLLRELRTEEEQLGRDDALQNKRVEDGDTWARVQRSKGQENHVHQDMSGSKQTEEPQRDGQRIPDRHLPHIGFLVWVSARLGRVRCDNSSKVSKWRRGRCAGLIHLHTSCGGG